MLEYFLVSVWTALSPVHAIGLQHRATFEPYVRAMIAYEATALHRGPGFLAHFMVGADLPDRAPWTWFGPDGSSVRRIGDGRFRLSSGDLASNWFAAIDCDLVAPAELACSDGTTRKLSAPDLQTVIVDDVAFTRFLGSQTEITSAVASPD